MPNNIAHTKKLQTLIYLLIGALVYAQNNIKIKVLDHEKTPINSAIYQLKENNKIVKYGKTDENGFAQINIGEKKPTDYIIKITKFGYEPYEEYVKTNDLSISLTLKETQIREVVIRNANIFKTKEDTIFYNLKNIRDGNEAKLEDLVKKLPGLEIDDNGKVKYQGNNIGNVLVEGQEFFGQQHQMATKNINAEIIEGIDFIRKHTRDDGTTTSALNVKLKEKYRNLWNGDVELGGGFTDKYYAHSNLFNFKKTGNTAVITDFNNIAKSPISLSDYLEFKEGNKIMKEGTHTFYPPEFLTSGKYFSNRRNQFLGIQVNEKLSQKLRLKFYSMLNFNQQNKHSNTERTYFSPNITSYDTDASKNHSFFLHTKTTLNYTIAPKHFINYDLVLNPMSDSGNRHIIRSFSPTNTQNINQQLSDNNFSFGQNLKYQNPISETLTLGIELNQNSVNQNETINLFANQNLFDTKENQLTQNLKFTENSYRFASNLAIKQGYNRYNINAEFRTQNFGLNTKDTQLNLTNNYHTMGISWDRSWSNTFNSVLGANFINTQNNLHNQKNYDFFRLEPNIGLSYNPKRVGNFRINASLGHTQYSIHELYPSYIKDFQNIYNSTLDLDNYVKKLQINFRYFKFGVRDGSFLSLGYSYSKDFNPISSRIINDLFWQKHEKTIVDYSEMQNFNFSYDFKIKNAPLNIKNNVYGYFNKNIEQINTQQYLTTYQKIQGGQRLVSNFNQSLFQFDLGYKIDYSQYKNNYFHTTNQQIDYALNLNIKGNYKEKLFWNLGVEYINQNSHYYRNNFFSLNPEISLKQKSIEFALRGNNVFNLKGNHLIRNTQTTYYQQVSIIDSFPGYLIFSVKFKI